jgi:hypothetical protein
MPPNSISFAQNLQQECQTFYAHLSPKGGMAGPRWGLRSWFDTAYHHSLDPYGGYGMVLQQQHIPSQQNSISFAQNL